MEGEFVLLGWQEGERKHGARGLCLAPGGVEWCFLSQETAVPARDLEQTKGGTCSRNNTVKNRC